MVRPKILLLALNARFTHVCLALRCLRQELRGLGHDPILVETPVQEGRVRVLDIVAGQCPDVIMIPAYIWNSEFLRGFLPDLRALFPRLAIIVGGPEVAYCPEAWLAACPQIDIVVAGQGEAAMRELQAVGFCYGRPTVLRPRPLALDDLAFPYAEEDRGDFPLKYLYYESSRGCPFSCAFCLSGRDDQSLEFRSLDKVRRELAFLSRSQDGASRAPIVKFVDRSFNADPARAREIWEYLIDLDSQALFHFEIRPSLLGPDDFRVLARVPPGRFQFEMGVQTITRESLSQIGRGPDWEAARRGITGVLALGRIHCHLDLIAGLPGDDMSSFGRCLDQVLELRADHVQLGFLKLLPGTELADKAQELGLIAQGSPPYQVLASPGFTPGDFARLRAVEEFLDSLWNRGLGRDYLRAKAGEGSSYFEALLEIQARAEREGFDPRTREGRKLAAFMAADGWPLP